MNPKNLLRQSSLKVVRTKSEDIGQSPYSKPMRPKQSTNNLLAPIVVRRGKRLLTPPSLSSLQMQEFLEKNTEGLDFDKEKENQERIANDMEYQRQDTIPSGLNCTFLLGKLEEKLKSIRPNDFQGKFDAYFAIFDLIIIADSKYSQILSKVKSGIIDNMKEKYREKIQKYKYELDRKNQALENIKSDSKRNIQKLSELSSQNIDLMTSNEHLTAKCTSLEGSVKLCRDYKGDVNVLLEELRVKSEKIRELNYKLEEMSINETKIMQIVEKLKNQGVEFEKIYQETQVRRNNDKKLKKEIPLIKIVDLDKEMMG
ncbi:hypothetical protein SteCoe_34224 [Stentor coeruleus]|uniref:Translin-associated factor X-interacting protein 1 N-terminal domain-containing protein n=1 Tax=Stentor coeruleus TaxID=5963 RepID=A0A1R2AV04_9CILI|nr:hypothetical protein SteCoe_34224 [Stentor coeruleus]